MMRQKERGILAPGRDGTHQKKAAGQRGWINTGDNLSSAQGARETVLGKELHKEMLKSEYSRPEVKGEMKLFPHGQPYRQESENFGEEQKKRGTKPGLSPRRCRGVGWGASFTLPHGGVLGDNANSQGRSSKAKLT